NLFYSLDTTVMNNGICKYNAYCDNAVVLGPTECAYKTDYTELVEEVMASGDPDPTARFDWTYGRWVSIFSFFDSHPDLKAEAEEKWPGFFDITTDISRWRDREFCQNSSLIITGNRCFSAKSTESSYRDTLAKYSTIEDNLVYSLSENPVFINPTLGDYRIREGADFPDIHFEMIGRY
ncbi:MAG: hypothetical protein J5874_00495, partial [Oscillospiraceae bacterium]|nr:hypothetical protein [Oscillospiraceae bacterium]